MPYDVNPHPWDGQSPRQASQSVSTGYSSSVRHWAPPQGLIRASFSVPRDNPHSARDQRSLQWPRLADDMFRLAHRDRDGMSLLDPHMAGLGMAAALLGELVLAGHLTIRAGVVVMTDASAPSDVLAHSVLDQIGHEHQSHPLRTWLAYLGRRAYIDVAGRLEREGHVRAEVSRRVLTRTVRYVPTDMNAAAWPWARLAREAGRSGQPDDFDTLLGGLAVATNLHRVVLIGDATSFAAALRPSFDRVAAPIRELIANTKAAAGDAVITKN